MIVVPQESFRAGTASALRWGPPSDGRGRPASVRPRAAGLPLLPLALQGFLPSSHKSPGCLSSQENSLSWGWEAAECLALTLLENEWSAAPKAEGLREGNLPLSL